MTARAVLFDLDDTLIVYNGVAERAWRHACEAELPPHLVSDEVYLEAFLSERRAYWSDGRRAEAGRRHPRVAQLDVATAVLRRLGVTDPKVIEGVVERYAELRESLVYLAPGAVELLRYLRRSDLPLALVTNGTTLRQRSKLERFGLDHYFDAIVVEEEVGFGKPNALCFMTALQQLRVALPGVWMVGDDLERDVKGALAAGLSAVWITSSPSASAPTDNYAIVEDLTSVSAAIGIN